MLLAPVPQVIPAPTTMFNVEICDWPPFVFHPVVRDHGAIAVTAVLVTPSAPRVQKTAGTDSPFEFLP